MKIKAFISSEQSFYVKKVLGVSILTTFYVQFLYKNVFYTCSFVYYFLAHCQKSVDMVELKPVIRNIRSKKMATERFKDLGTLNFPMVVWFKVRANFQYCPSCLKNTA
jgi:hypothetical protein